MMAASTGSFSVSGVSRALEPWTISTISPWPAPTVSTTTKVRPMPMSRSRCCGSTRSGSTVSRRWPVIEATFCVATTVPVTRARNIEFPLLLPSPLGGEGSKADDSAFRLQKRLGLPGDDQLLVGRHDPDLHLAIRCLNRHLALRAVVLVGIEGDTKPLQVDA